MDVLIEGVVERHELGGVTDRPCPPSLSKSIIQAILWLDSMVINGPLLAGNYSFFHPIDSLLASELGKSIMIKIVSICKLRLSETRLRLEHNVLHHFSDGRNSGECRTLAVEDSDVSHTQQSASFISLAQIGG